MAKSAKHANNVFLGITKKKGGMMDPGRCRVMFDHRGQIIAKPPQSEGYSTDIAEEDAIEIGMLTKKTTLLLPVQLQTQRTPSTVLTPF